MRWQLEIIAPPGGGHSEPRFARTEFLVEGGAAVLDARLRFLWLRTCLGDQLWDEGVVREAAVRVTPTSWKRWGQRHDRFRSTGR